MNTPPCRTRASIAAIIALAAGALAPQSVRAQVDQAAAGPAPLSAGDSVRIDGDLVGRVLSIDGPRLTVVSRGESRCRAGQMHGDAPICDPAPLLRNEMDLSEVQIERRMQKGNVGTRTLIGGVIGAAAFGAAGYFIGPAVGFGRVDPCLNTSGLSRDQCYTSNGLTAEGQAEKQKQRDQRLGVLFFGAVGATLFAVIGRKTSVGWVHVQPTVPIVPSDPWGVVFRVPTAH